MVTAIDLFAGLGGWSLGAQAAGVKVLWAANHWKVATDLYEANHPGAKIECQDLHQANWALVPGHDLMLASPCCQGHSRARGKKNGNPQHDASRSTAWAVVNGDRMRMLTADENLKAMSFSADIKRPHTHKLTVHLAGNAVPPLAGQHIIQTLLSAA